MVLKKYTRVLCLNDVTVEDAKGEEVVIFEKGHTYKIVGYDFHSLIYYISPDDTSLPDEFAITALEKENCFMMMKS